MTVNRKTDLKIRFYQHYKVSVLSAFQKVIPIKKQMVYFQIVKEQKKTHFGATYYFIFIRTTRKQNKNIQLQTKSY